MPKTNTRLRRVAEVEDDLIVGRRALASFDWEEARRRFSAVLDGGESAEAHEGLATALCWLGDMPAALRSYESAFLLYQASDRPRDAARQAIFLALEHTASLGDTAVANGWFRRAHRLLDPLVPGPEHAWLALWEGHIAFLFRDEIATGRERLAAATEIARGLGLRDVELFATGMEGLLRVAEGRIGEGLPLLDEAATAAASGELNDLQAVGQAFCYMLRACELTHDFDRAGQWLEVAREGSRRTRIDYRLSYCRSHHAAILVWRGALAEAESELETAMRELAPIAPASLPESRARLGDLRRRQGRYEEAAKLFAEGESSPFATLGRAAMALDQGDAAAAVELTERYFRRLPAKDRIQRIPGLALLVRALGRLGASDRLSEALDDLRGIALDTATPGALATLEACEGIAAFASGDFCTARDRFEAAIVSFDRSGAAFETARARLDLAEALLRLGHPTTAREEAETARRRLAELGAQAELERAERLLAELAADGTGDATPAPGTPPHGLTARQVEVLRLVAAGLSNRDIGARLFLSEFTVKRHVADILTKLDLPTRAAAASFATRHQLV